MIGKKENGSVSDFIELCVYRISKEYASFLAEKAHFSTKEWLQVHDYCCGGQCYNMQVIAIKKAIAGAKTLTDWIAIAGQTRGENRNLAFRKVLQYEPTEEDIPLFCESGSIRLWDVGWYLAGRLEHKRENSTVATRE